MAEIRLTTWDVWNPINNGKNYQPQLVIAGFQPSTHFQPTNTAIFCIPFGCRSTPLRLLDFSNFARPQLPHWDVPIPGKGTRWLQCRLDLAEPKKITLMKGWKQTKKIRAYVVWQSFLRKLENCVIRVYCALCWQTCYLIFSTSLVFSTQKTSQCF